MRFPDQSLKSSSLETERRATRCMNVVNILHPYSAVTIFTTFRFYETFPLNIDAKFKYRFVCRDFLEPPTGNRKGVIPSKFISKLATVMSEGQQSNAPQNAKITITLYKPENYLLRTKFNRPGADSRKLTKRSINVFFWYTSNRRDSSFGRWW